MILIFKVDPYSIQVHVPICRYWFVIDDISADNITRYPSLKEGHRNISHSPSHPERTNFHQYVILANISALVLLLIQIYRFCRYWPYQPIPICQPWMPCVISISIPPYVIQCGLLCLWVLSPYQWELLPIYVILADISALVLLPIPIYRFCRYWPYQPIY